MQFLLCETDSHSVGTVWENKEINFTSQTQCIHTHLELISIVVGA